MCASADSAEKVKTRRRARRVYHAHYLRANVAAFAPNFGTDSLEGGKSSITSIVTERNKYWMVGDENVPCMCLYGTKSAFVETEKMIIEAAALGVFVLFVALVSSLAELATRQQLRQHHW